MFSSESTANILKAMIEAAPEISSISKSKQAYGYKYATLDSLIDMLRGVLPNHGLWFMQMPTRTGEKSALTTRIFHTSGEWIEDSIEMTDTELQGKVNDTQKVGASITYFRRYALSSIFGVAADEDVDGNLNSANPPQSKPAPKQAPKQPQQALPPKQKLDPLTYLNDDWSKRIAAGESPESISKDYADILKTDSQREIKDLNETELKLVAVAIYKRNCGN
jgi:hypothetical protein